MQIVFSDVDVPIQYFAVCLKSRIFKPEINAFNLNLPKHEILLLSLKWDDSDFFIPQYIPFWYDLSDSTVVRYLYSVSMSLS